VTCVSGLAEVPAPLTPLWLTAVNDAPLVPPVLGEPATSPAEIPAKAAGKPRKKPALPIVAPGE
jgi:hypothetical protein